MSHSLKFYRGLLKQGEILAPLCTVSVGEWFVLCFFLLVVIFVFMRN